MEGYKTKEFGVPVKRYCQTMELKQEGVQEVTVLLKSLLPYYFLDHFVMSAFL